MDPVKEKLWTELPSCWHSIATITKIDHKDKTMTNLRDNWQLIGWLRVNKWKRKSKSKGNKFCSIKRAINKTWRTHNSWPILLNKKDWNHHYEKAKAFFSGYEHRIRDFAPQELHCAHNNFTKKSFPEWKRWTSMWYSWLLESSHKSHPK